MQSLTQVSVPVTCKHPGCGGTNLAAYDNGFLLCLKCRRRQKLKKAQEAQ